MTKRRRDNSNLIAFRARGGAKERLDELVERHASNKSAVLNALILGAELPRKRRSPSAPTKLLGQLLAAVMQCNRLLQNVSLERSEQGALILEEISDILLGIRNALFKLLGRKP